MSDLILLPPNATAPERAISTAVAERMNAITTPVGTLWDADTCPIPLLPWLAWALSVDGWDSAWSETTKRAVLRSSVSTHRIKGTRGAVLAALEPLGFRVDLLEWFETGDAPHTFKLRAYGRDVYGVGFAVNQALFDLLDGLVDQTKPVRAHHSLGIGEAFDIPAGLRAGVRLRGVCSAELTPAPRPHEVASAAMLRAETCGRRTHRAELAPAPRSLRSRGGAELRAGLRGRSVSRQELVFTLRKGAVVAA